MGNTKPSGLFLLWMGAAISIAEIVTGTLIAPLGWKSGLLAILIGHVIGCFVFLLPAGYLSAQQNRTAIQATKTVFGQQGVWLFSLLNALQLLGWTAVMIVNAQRAMNGLSKALFNYRSVLVMSLIVAVLIVVWLLMDHEWLFKVNNVIVVLLAIGMLLMLWTIIKEGRLQNSANLAPLSFGSAVELNVTMALSWLPLIGDYTQHTEQPFKTSMASVSGYFIASVAMFSLGLFTVILTGQSDFTTVLSHSSMGMVALLVIVFSTVTTTFMDAYSAATNIANVVKTKSVNLLAVGVTVLGLLIALFVSMAYYQNFLSAIGAVFTPLFAILFVSVFLMHQRLSLPLNFIWWLIGFVGYSWLQKLDFFLGTTFFLLLVLGLGVYLTGLVTKKYPLMTD
ncbi:purine-cytosine transport protein [Secundilactobacillus pentosiphilus]|uniref:Purine-cytosine transport protein n=1 Tax=Secundilactobacillus pentosiphilus TaxID=1714682 RepID=A0A1Z5IT89_9LACO|nr:putative hydroxymethylpyrimidine transporter CytX [Secundilactobacillus pentosiphilus]GAX03041.1 purine-cytosine transport protein [Secundilactobacillus pentosiphilus]GAX04964.1 purine-cytosine transport protein [Secundilactobacillus pentosiphilus]